MVLRVLSFLTLKSSLLSFSHNREVSMELAVILQALAVFILWLSQGITTTLLEITSSGHENNSIWPESNVLSKRISRNHLTHKPWHNVFSRNFGNFYLCFPGWGYQTDSCQLHIWKHQPTQTNHSLRYTLSKYDPPWKYRIQNTENLKSPICFHLFGKLLHCFQYVKHV